MKLPASNLSTMKEIAKSILIVGLAGISLLADIYSLEGIGFVWGFLAFITWMMDGFLTNN